MPASVNELKKNYLIKRGKSDPEAKRERSTKCSFLTFDTRTSLSETQTQNGWDLKI